MAKLKRYTGVARDAARLAAAEVLCKYARHCEGCGAVNVKLYESFDGRKYRCRCGYDEARAAYKAAARAAKRDGKP